MRSPALAALSFVAVVLGGVCAVASPTSAEEIRGHVIEIAADAVYLDRGALDGLQPGSRVVVGAEAGAVVELTVARISDHHAVATPSPIAPTRPGDAWTAAVETGPPAPADTTTTPPPQPAIPDPATLAAAWEATLARPFPLRAFEPGARAAPARAARASRWLRATPTALGMTHGGATTSSYAGGLLALRGLAPIAGGGVRVNLDCDLVNWVTRPAGDRLRPRSNPSAQFYALSVDYFPASSGLGVSIGRMRPAGAGGAPLLDGAVVSWRPVSVGTARRTMELGAYGGTMPDPLTLAPASDRVSAGAFARSAGTFASGLAASARGRVSLVRSESVSQEEGHLEVALAARDGARFDGSATVAHRPGETVLAEGSAGLRRRVGASEAFAGYRESRPLLDPTLAAAYQDVLGFDVSELGHTQRADVGLSGPAGGKRRFSAVVGRSYGAGGFDRWTADARLTGQVRFGPITSWLVGYRGSAGWQEGHEGEVGCRIDRTPWQVDLSVGGGALHQNAASRTTPVGRGMLSVRRPVGREGSLLLQVWGQGQAHSISTAGRLGFSYQFQGGAR